MNTRNSRQKLKWSEEDRARHKAIRERFRDWHPGPEELLASGEYEAVGHDEYWSVRLFVASLKDHRQKAGLTLADLAKRAGIGKAQLSRLESGRQLNPTFRTLQRYAAALGKRIALGLEDAQQEGNGKARRAETRRAHKAKR